MLPLLRRAWAAPIAAHLAALLIVLVGGAFFVGTYASLTEDEGAAIVQARQLSEHGEWIRPHPHPELDPEGRNYPYHLSALGTKGFAPFAKHPLYALVLAGLWRVGSINALVGLSIAGTIAAAAVGSRFGRRFDHRLERPALWAVGLGSPLLLDSYLVIAHTIGAALAGALVLLITRRERTYQLAVVAAAAALGAALVFMRTEGVLFVGVTALVALAARDSRWPGLAAGAAGVAARFAESKWAVHIVGKPVAVKLTAEDAAREQALSLGAGGLQGRIDGAIHTLFRPNYYASTSGMLLVIGLVFIAGCVVLARRNPPLSTALGIAAAACALVRLIAEPGELVPGLFAAAPIVWAGAWAALMARRDGSFRVDWRLPAIVAGFLAAVLATQYSRGGGVEWGFRFFALALPVAVPLAVAALVTQPARVVRSVVFSAACMAVLAMLVTRHIHQRADDVLAAVEVPSDAIAITTGGQVARLDWRRYDERHWLLVAPRGAAELIGRLRAAGVHRAFLLVPDGVRVPGVAGVATRVGETRWRTIDIELD